MGSKFVDFHFEEFFVEELLSIYYKNALGSLAILKHFEMLKRKFCPGVEERSRLQLSYMGEDLNSTNLAELVKNFNSKHPVELALK